MKFIAAIANVIEKVSMIEVPLQAQKESRQGIARLWIPILICLILIALFVCVSSAGAAGYASTPRSPNLIANLAILLASIGFGVSLAGAIGFARKKISKREALTIMGVGLALTLLALAISFAFGGVNYQPAPGHNTSMITGPVAQELTHNDKVLVSLGTLFVGIVFLLWGMQRAGNKAFQKFGALTWLGFGLGLILVITSAVIAFVWKLGPFGWGSVPTLISAGVIALPGSRGSESKGKSKFLENLIWILLIIAITIAILEKIPNRIPDPRVAEASVVIQDTFNGELLITGEDTTKGCNWKAYDGLNFLAQWEGNGRKCADKPDEQADSFLDMIEDGVKKYLSEMGHKDPFRLFQSLRQGVKLRMTIRP